MIQTHNKKNIRNHSQKGEAGFTMVELIIVMVLTSVLAIYTFQILTNSLATMRDLRVRKVMNDDAIIMFEKFCRELRVAGKIHEVGATTEPYVTGQTNILFQKHINSSGDPLTYVRYIFNDSSITGAPDSIWRQGGFGTGMFPSTSTLPGFSSEVAQNIVNFIPGVTNVLGAATVFPIIISGNLIDLQLDFSNNPDWATSVSPRNYGTIP